MFKLLRGMLSGTIYAQLWENRINIVHIESQITYDQKPWIAINVDSKKQVVKAVGDEAYAMRGQPGIEVSNPFSHPRLLVNGYIKAEKLLQHGIRAVSNAKIFSPSPIVVIHPREKLAGGITDIECRLFRELALGAGAREVRLHIGEELNPSDFDLSKVVEPTP